MLRSHFKDLCRFCEWVLNDLRSCSEHIWWRSRDMRDLVSGT